MWSRRLWLWDCVRRLNSRTIICMVIFDKGACKASQGLLLVAVKKCILDRTTQIFRDVQSRKSVRKKMS